MGGIVSELRNDPAALTFASAAAAAILVPTIAVTWKALKWSASTIRSAVRVWQTRSHVVNVNTIDSPYFDKFVEIYHMAFSEDERVSTEEVECWLSGKGSCDGVSYHISLAISRRKAVGFAISMYGAQENILYIPYVAVTGFGSRWTTTRMVLTQLYSSMRRSIPVDARIAVEVLDPDEKGLSDREKARRSARIKRLKAISRAIGLQMIGAEVEYRCPSFETDAERSPDRVVLLFLLMSGTIPAALPRLEVVRIISFIYRKVYLGCHPGAPESREEYEGRLERELERQLRALPELVPLRTA